MARPKKSSKPTEDGGQAEPSRRTRIVVQAGSLFAAKGYHGVSMREIAEAADVQLSLIVYHFATKENLYRSVFDHFHGIFEERLGLLREVTNLTAPDALRRVVEAFVRPVQRAQASSEGKIYSALVLREASDPEQDERGIIRDYYDPMARQFIAALKVVLPDKPDDRLAWGYLFTVSALVMSLIDRRMERLSPGGLDPECAEQKFECLIRYICAGLAGI